MKIKNLITSSVIAAGVLAGSSAANAGEIEANVSLATDYVFRGFSQTNEDPAISGGFDYGFEGGFYLGVWGSNVNFGEGSNTSTEIDLYGGYAFDAAENVSFDFGYVYFVYPGETSSLNYSEFLASVSISGFTLGAVFSPDYFGSDSNAVVINADYSFSLGGAWGLDLHAGFTTTEDDDIAAPGDDYTDYSVAITTSGAGVDFALTFYGTDVDDVDIADERVVFSISKAF